MRSLLLLLALLAQPAPPPLRATWERPDVARVAFSGAGCLFHGRTLYRCYDAGQMLLLGARGPIDAADRPRVGDVFVLVREDGTQERSSLRGIVYLAVWR